MKKHHKRAVGDEILDSTTRSNCFHPDGVARKQSNFKAPVSTLAAFCRKARTGKSNTTGGQQEYFNAGVSKDSLEQRSSRYVFDKASPYIRILTQNYQH